MHARSNIVPDKHAGCMNAHNGRRHAPRLAEVVFVFSLAATSAMSGQIVQLPANYEISPGRVELLIELTNNDNGTVYDSYDLFLFGPLGASLWNLPHNQIAYTDIDDLKTDWSIGIRPPPWEVDSGWYLDTASYLPLAIRHTGWGETWFSSDQDINQDSMGLILSIPSSQLDGDGDGYSTNDIDDWRIVIAEDPVTNMGVGIMGIWSSSASARPYLVRPTAWQIESSCATGGSIAPNGTTPVMPAGATNFAISPDPHFHIAAVLTNGYLISNTNPTNMVVPWINPTDDGSIHAIFEPDQTTSSTPIYWLVSHGFTSDWETAASDDPDHDGLTTGQEWQTGTDPTNPLSRLAVTRFEIVGNQAELRWSGYADRRYGVLEIPALNGGATSILSSTVVSDSEQVAVVPVPASTGAFWALRAAWQNPHPPQLSLATNEVFASVSFCEEAPPTSRFAVANSGGGVLAYSVSPTAPWLTVQPTSGVCGAETDRITISFDWLAATGNVTSTQILIHNVSSGADTAIVFRAQNRGYYPRGFTSTDWTAYSNVYPSMTGTSVLFTANHQIRRFMNWAANYRFRVRLPSSSGTNTTSTFVGLGLDWAHNDRILGLRFAGGQVHMWDTGGGGSDRGLVGVYPLDTWITVNLQYTCNNKMLVRGEGLWGEYSQNNQLIWFLISHAPGDGSFEMSELVQIY